MTAPGSGEEDRKPGFSIVRGLERPPGNLPVELSSFVGREREISEIKGLLAGRTTRLLTLCGPGGAGKTRLAMAVAFEAVESFEDGVRWVGLASLSDPELVPQAVAQALSVSEQPGLSLTDALAASLREKRLLLVLDNCEHLIEACARFAQTMLVSCPRLQILATSREALGIAGEANWRVPSLAMPARGRLPSSSKEAMRYEAVELFVERARSRLSTFELTDENAEAVAEVCRKLDGIPLAIELAAARVRALSVEQISERLEDPLGLLTAGDRDAVPRQQTLRATLAWSHELLGEREQKLFCRMSVFAGGWTLEAAEAVGEGEDIERDQVLDLLSALVDKSLVVVEPGEGTSRYAMLEPVRQYGRERLEESGEADAARRRHAEWFLALAEEAEPELPGAHQERWLKRLETEHDNFRAALSWALEGGEAELGLRLGGALGGFWLIRSYLSEGRRWLETGLAEASASPAPVRAKVLGRAGSMALWQNDLEPAVALLEESLGLFETLGDEAGMASAFTDLGHAVLHQDDKGRLKALCAEAEALRRKAADRWAVAELLFFLGMVALYEGDPERATAVLEESLASFRELGDTAGVYACRTYLWIAALERGDPLRAATLIEEDLRGLRGRPGTEPQLQAFDDLLGSAVVAALRGEPARAARLWGAAEALREFIGVPLPLWEHVPTDHERHLVAARSRLGETAWEAAWSEGTAMTLEEAIEYALGTSPAPPPKGDKTVLSEREAEILHLVAQGLTDPQVAERLYLSSRTVGQHLRSIYRKLGVPSRAAAAKVAVERDLI